MSNQARHSVEEWELWQESGQGDDDMASLDPVETLYFSIYEYDYYNNAEPTGAAWCWDSYFTEKPTDFEKVLRSECGLMLECWVAVEVPLALLERYQNQEGTAQEADATAQELMALIEPHVKAVIE